MASNSNIILGPRGDRLIKNRETLRLVAFLPTPNDVPTIGWGHTKGVKLGDTCTLVQARQWYAEDTAEAIAAVASLPCPLTQSMIDALISLVYNVGSRALYAQNAIGRALRSSPPDYFTAWAGFALWRKQSGRDMLGLASRRSEEMLLFFEDGLPKMTKE